MGKGSLQLSSATFGSELGNLVGFLSHRGNRVTVSALGLTCCLPLSIHRCLALRMFKLGRQLALYVRGVPWKTAGSECGAASTFLYLVVSEPLGIPFNCLVDQYLICSLRYQ